VTDQQIADVLLSRIGGHVDLDGHSIEFARLNTGGHLMKHDHHLVGVFHVAGGRVTVSLAARYRTYVIPQPRSVSITKAEIHDLASMICDEATLACQSRSGSHPG